MQCMSLKSVNISNRIPPPSSPACRRNGHSLAHSSIVVPEKDLVVEYTIICDPSKVNRLPTSGYNNNSPQGYPCTADQSGQHMKTKLPRKGGNHLLGAELAASCVAVCDYDDDHHPQCALHSGHIITST